MKKQELEPFLTVGELATRWRVSRRSVNRWMIAPPAGKPPLKATAIGRRRLIYLDSIKEWERAK